jgi:hypothetical protein
MLRKISSFCQVKLVPKSLLVLDIDETILKYKHGDTYIDRSWWSAKRQHFFDEHCDEKIAKTKAFEYWIDHIYSTYPIHTDKDGLMKLFNDATDMNIDIIFLTARSQFLKKITLHHLNYLDIPINKIYFSGGTKKHDVLSNLLDTEFTHIDHIIMIDDHEDNLQGIHENIKKGLDLYQFEA